MSPLPHPATRRHRPLRSPARALAVLIAAATLPAPAPAQVGVYEVSFRETGTTLNYDFYTGGYFITDLPQGSGNFILTIRENARRFYSNTTGSGQLFLVRDGSIRMSAVSAEGGTDSATSTLLATGASFERTNIGGSISLPVTRRLSGMFLAYEAGGNPGGDTFRVTEGLAGFSEASMRFDLSLTREVNNDFLDVGQATTRVIEHLQRDGFLPEPTPTPAPSPTPGPSPSPTPGTSPTPTPSPTATPAPTATPTS